jgi:cell division transport system ATP-binding protein
VIEGPTGSGKTTLLKLLIGAEQAEHGQIFVNGVEIRGPSTPRLSAVRRSLGLMVQGIPLLPELTVADNVGLPLKAARIATRDRRLRIYEALKTFGLEGRRSTYPRQLSGGEIQRVCLARALVTRPAVLLTDEPTTSLDDGTAKDVVEILRDAHRRGLTLLAATHTSRLAHQLGSRRLLLENGQTREVTDGLER